MKINYLDSQGSKAARNGAEFEKISGLAVDKLHSKYTVDVIVDKIKNEYKNKGYIILDDDQVICKSYPKDQLEVYLNENGLYRKEMDIESDEDLDNVGVYVNGVINIEIIKPDDCVVNNMNNTIYIVEQKFQKSGGSVDEKIRTFDYRLKYFKKIFVPLGMKVKLIYVFNDWFKKKQYLNVKKEMMEAGIDIYYNSLPPHAIGLDENTSTEEEITKTKEITLW